MSIGTDDSSVSTEFAARLEAMPSVASPRSSVEGRHSLIRVEHLSKAYAAGGLLGRSGEQTPVIDDISFEVAPGETLGLVGHSGSGKTTLRRAMLRLVEPRAGWVFVTLSTGDTVDLMELGAQEFRAIRRHIQIVFQDPYTSLDPRMRIGDVIEEPLRIHDIVAPADVAVEPRSCSRW